MAQMNRIAATLTAADRDAVLAAVETIRQRLPFLVDLSPQERQRLPKFSDETQGYARLALDVAKGNPDALPGLFDADAFAEDLALMDALAPVRLAVTQLHEHVEDTHTLLKHEAYVDALYVHRQVQGTPTGAALDAEAAALGLRFARRRTPPAGGGG